MKNLITAELNNNLARARLEAFPRSDFAESLFLPITREIVELGNAVVEENWEDVAVFGSRCLGLGYGAFRALQRDAISATKALRALESSNAILANVFRAMAKSEFREDLATKSSEFLAENRPDLLAKVEDSLRLFKKGETKNVPILKRLGEIKARSATSSLLKDGVLLGLSRGLLGLTHAEFNLTFNALREQAGFLGYADLLSPFESLVYEISSALRECQLNIQNKLAGNQSVRKVVLAAIEMAGLIEEFLPSFSRIQAQMFHAAQALREQGKGGASEEMGGLAARAGFTTREAIASHVASYRLILELLDPDPAEEIVNLQKNASTLAFDVNLPDGKNTPLAKLDEVEDGDFVEVEAYAKTFQVVRLPDGKLISRLNLVDPSSGAQAIAVIVFTHMPHAGVTEGAFCRINGAYLKQSQLLEGQAGIQVDRLSLAQLSEISWRIAFLRSADRWYQPWRNGLNMYWSLGPHHRSIPEDESRLGAGEILYLPFRSG